MKGSISATSLRSVPESILDAIKDQASRIWPVIIIGFGTGILAVMGSFFLSRYLGIPPEDLTRDPASVANLGTYIGLLSNLGIILWAATTGICFCAAASLKAKYPDRHPTIFFFSSSLLSFILMLDDTFQIHESIFPHHFHIPETIVYAGYLIIMVGYLLYFFRYILRTDYLYLILTVGFLGLSLISERLLNDTFIEDSLKFIGIVFWLVYFSSTAIRAVRNGTAGAMPKS